MTLARIIDLDEVRRARASKAVVQPAVGPSNDVMMPMWCYVWMPVYCWYVG